MKRSFAAFFVVFGLVLSGTGYAGLFDVFKKDLDKVPETDELRRSEAAAQTLVTEALEYESAGKTDKAFDIYRGVVKKYPLTTAAAMSQYKVGAIQKANGDWVKAFESFQTFHRRIQAELCV